MKKNAYKTDPGVAGKASEIPDTSYTPGTPDTPDTPENAVLEQTGDYGAAALFLMREYGNLLKEQEYVDKVLSGETIYTEDDALEELISTTASTESDTGIRVQTSNISNTTERIGLLLASGFVEKRNRQILKEIIKDAENRQYLCWKIDVIETAVRERTGTFERGLFKRHYAQGWTYKKIRERYSKKKLYNRDISRACRIIQDAIADEIEARSYRDDEAGWTGKLLREAKDETGY